MNDKTFKIKPKVWPKEYTFEEFKRLNPNVNENTLINYYNKYLQEYAEDRSRHLIHFNDVKDNLSKELHLLNEKLIDTITDNQTQDQTVGPSGAGRKFRSPLGHVENSIEFDRVDEAIMLDYKVSGSLPGDGTLKPYKGLTAAVWFNTSWIQDFTLSTDPQAPNNTSTVYTIFAGAEGQTGWRLYYSNYRLIGHIAHTDPEQSGGGGKNVLLNTSFKALHDSNPAKQLYRADGWHYAVMTWDGKEQILYVDGRVADASGDIINPAYANNNPSGLPCWKWDIFSGGGGTSGTNIPGFSASALYPSNAVTNTTYATTSGSLGAIHYANQGTTSYTNNHKVNVVIGARANANGTTGFWTNNTEYYSGSISECAVWDVALDAVTINELWHNGISGSSNSKFDLSYSGYGGNGGNSYDIHDEGLSYKNVGRYADSLQGWWMLDNVTQTTNTISGSTPDFSGKGRTGTLFNISSSGDYLQGSAPGVPPL